MRLPIVAGLALIALACGPASTDTPPPIEALRAQMRSGGIPGASVAVLRRGEIAWSDALGLADIEARATVDAQTLFIVASVSKTVVAVAALQLAESGRLDLDVPIDPLLGFSVRHPDFPDAPITARMLLTHTSGLQDDFLSLGQVSYDGDPPIDLATFTQRYVSPQSDLFRNTHLGAEPGQKYAYCNAAFGVLGAVVEAAAQEDLRSYTKRMIFGPAGMERAGWFLEDVSPEHLSALYAGTWEAGFTRLDQPGFGFYPATSLRSSATELAQFLLAVHEGELLTESSLQQLVAAQTPQLSPDQGLAWQHRSINGRSYVGHSGATPGGSAYLYYSAEHRTGLVFLNNSDAFIRAQFGQPKGAQAMREILELLERWAAEN